MTRSPTRPLTAMGWGDYMTHWVDHHGGWVALSDALIHRARGVVEIPIDPQSVEKGLRRLATREHRDGGQYGRWMLRFFGVPANVAAWLKWMGQYHSRFSDLPVTLRSEQLQLWDRAPMRDSTHAIWLHLGLASVCMRSRDREGVTKYLSLARAKSAAADPAAQIEALLLEARVRSDEGDIAACAQALDAVSAILDDASSALTREDHVHYESRLLDQRAYRLLHPERGERDLSGARALYTSIASGELDAFPYAAYQRALGLAYCSWKQGDLERARALASRAVSHAGDAGLVRFRVVALNLWSRIEGEDEDGMLRRRARRLALQLDDEDLQWRVARQSPR